MSQPSYTGSTAGLGRNLDTFSSRSAYPTFLTPQDTALLQLKAAGRGILDACRWDVVIRLIARYICTSAGCLPRTKHRLLCPSRFWQR